MIRPERLLKNIATLVSGTLAARVLSLAFVILVVRSLSVSEFGNYSLAVTVVGILSMFTDLGLNMLTQREISQIPEQTPRYWIHVLLMKGLLVLLIGAGMVAAAFLVPYPPEARLALGVGAVLLAVMTVNQFFSSIFLAQERMSRHALCDIVEKAGTLLFGVAAVLFGFLQAASILAVRILAGLLSAGMAYGWIKPSVRKPWPPWEKFFCQELVSKSWPFALYMMLWVISFRIDTVMLYSMRGAEDVALYNAAYTVFETVVLLGPALVMRAVFPTFSKAYVRSPEEFEELYQDALPRMLLAALGITLCFLIGSHTFLNLAFGKVYASSAQALKILSLGFPFVFWSILMGQRLVAAHQEKKVAWALAAAVVINVGGNLWAIPRYGISGASATTVITEAADWLLLWFFVRQGKRNGTEHP